MEWASDQAREVLTASQQTHQGLQEVQSEQLVPAVKVLWQLHLAVVLAVVVVVPIDLASQVQVAADLARRVRVEVAAGLPMGLQVAAARFLLEVQVALGPAAQRVPGELKHLQAHQVASGLHQAAFLQLQLGLGGPLAGVLPAEQQHLEGEQRLCHQQGPLVPRVPPQVALVPVD